MRATHRSVLRRGVSLCEIKVILENCIYIEQKSTHFDKVSIYDRKSIIMKTGYIERKSDSASVVPISRECSR